jgi:hypothetical protein
MKNSSLVKIPEIYFLNSDMAFLTPFLWPKIAASSPVFRSGFKTSDQVQGQGVRPIGKAQHT